MSHARAAAGRVRARRVRQPMTPGRVVMYLLLVVTLVIFLVPIYWMFLSAFKPQADVYTWPIKWVTVHPTMANFTEAMRAAPFLKFFWNSVVTSVVGTVVELIFAVMCAYAFVFIKAPFKGFMFMLVLGSMMLPGHVTLLVNYITISQMDLLNTYAGIILPALASSFIMFLLYQEMRTVPDELIESARMDGAGHLTRMMRVVMPICQPMVITAALITFMGKWNAYVWPLIVTSTADMRTLPIGLKFLQNDEGGTNWGAVMAGSVMAAAPMLILFFIAQKKIVGGLAAGAVKG
ncbi:ABC-type sugar transport system, permease component [Acidipropionibacterium acidipropionici ATCC 4875]|uniref:ABC-type sugar transport system, permease component n=2 Tax=Acidipropionibacterium acidipropionici TaxID=1748 RepID=K7SP16_ACIA4|nr:MULTISPECIES: carbohydrate ABC transporter permease [Acidipropionibacterium]AFV90950.1 ABC-type sugar transport system, permease component [Acidipropionibacterium acidipropionici ATCC 4875]ALN14940.1 glycerol-3-phosphate ABC transporter permease [Acidipropionibacterium acidipropionici]APZ09308.1 glycerol-3-phosphate ABC transporter permease [Acidipropionibacterium acidipropionici]MDN6812447.1 carbohydrate ABC transporter permease [Acidipropionibacterium jensenii]